jgi:hypothetical protein
MFNPLHLIHFGVPVNENKKPNSSTHAILRRKNERLWKEMLVKNESALHEQCSLVFSVIRAGTPAALIRSTN